MSDEEESKMDSLMGKFDLGGSVGSASDDDEKSAGDAGVGKEDKGGKE